MFTKSSPLILFPKYLLPSAPFHRRLNRTESGYCYDCDEPAGRTHHSEPTNAFAEGPLSSHRSHLRCAKCAIDICPTSQIVSKGFTGRHGRAYLVSPSASSISTSETFRASKNTCLLNTKTDSPTSRQLVTGTHTVSDVRCAFCSSLLGWKYDEAEEESQRYKVGKYILETKMICSSSNWENEDRVTPPVSLQVKQIHDANGEGGVEFDSQDEDECEDLFAGVWSPSLARKRRHNKVFRSAASDVLAGTNFRR